MQHKLMQDTHLKTNSWTTISRDRSNAYIDLGWNIVWGWLDVYCSLR